jgi:DNA helicase-2/ATP-dependent DNA helicase PcrA
LVGLPRRLSVLTPPNEAIALSAIRGGYASDSKLSETLRAEKVAREEGERSRVSREEGRICFDLFAPFVGDIVDKSQRVRELIATMYPLIILDEFQDTNAVQWRVVQALGRNSMLLALADPQQRIFDFIGADPERLDHFRKVFAPTEVDLSTDNHRSPGTDIAIFGNDVLTGKFRESGYVGIDFELYEANASQALTSIVTTTYAARKRLVDAGKKDWSLAILVPTKKMTRLVSETFRSPPAGMKPISHVAAIDIEAAILAAEIIAVLMQPEVGGRHFAQLVDLLCNYYQGKGAGTPTQKDLKEAERTRKAYSEWIARLDEGKDIKKNSILVKMLAVYDEARALTLSGDPDKDWLSIRRVLDKGACVRMKEVAKEVRNVRLLERGTQLRQELSQDWRDNGGYANALTIVRQAFVKEHFSTNSRPEKGVVVLNMHKSKGKQFDEVIIFEGWPRVSYGKIVANPDRIVWGNARANCDDQARQNLRVSVTRGRQRTTLLTPREDPCILLLKED